MWRNSLGLLLPVFLSLFAAAAALAGPLEDAQLTCLIEPSQAVSVSSATEGVVTAVAVDRGDTVAVGDLLVELESSLERSLLARAEARARYARRELQRNKEMISRDLLSEKEVDELRTNNRVAQLELRAAKHELERRTTRSPIDGIVFERSIAVGEYVSEAPMLELVSINPLHAEVVMSVDAYGKIEVGMDALISLGAPVHEERISRVANVDRIIDPTSSTFRIRMEIPNEEMSTPSGLSCNIVEFRAAEDTPEVSELRPAQKGPELLKLRRLPVDIMN